MKSRLLTSLALGATIILSTTGCSMITEQATTIPYSASDGVNIPDSGPLKVRNALLVADESGASANFLAAVVNDTDTTETLLVGLDGATQTVRVPARSAVSLGFDGSDPLLFPRLDSAPGTNVELTFQSGDGEGVAYFVPVLDGTLDYLADFVPQD
ncbi:DNA modification methylase [uncultured Microbacterium sp.]|uniref:DNA modification methylase n=1 Tax=uncultured Microbacterium sp. TaxID=191216 RepID=UPI002607D528|nr:DNA modification methylase [uncultured Microbacterium sp.]